MKKLLSGLVAMFVIALGSNVMFAQQPAAADPDAIVLAQQTVKELTAKMAAEPDAGKKAELFRQITQLNRDINDAKSLKQQAANGPAAAPKLTPGQHAQRGLSQQPTEVFAALDTIQKMFDNTTMDKLVGGGTTLDKVTLGQFNYGIDHPLQLNRDTVRVLTKVRNLDRAFVGAAKKVDEGIDPEAMFRSLDKDLEAIEAEIAQNKDIELGQELTSQIGVLIRFWRGEIENRLGMLKFVREKGGEMVKQQQAADAKQAVADKERAEIQEALQAWRAQARERDVKELDELLGSLNKYRESGDRDGARRVTEEWLKSHTVDERWSSVLRRQAEAVNDRALTVRLTVIGQGFAGLKAGTKKIVLLDGTTATFNPRAGTFTVRPGQVIRVEFYGMDDSGTKQSASGLGSTVNAVSNIPGRNVSYTANGRAGAGFTITYDMLVNEQAGVGSR